MTTPQTSANEPSGVVRWFNALANRAVSEFTEDSSATNLSTQEGKLMRSLFLARANDSERNTTLPTSATNTYWEQVLTQARDKGLFGDEGGLSTKPRNQLSYQQVGKGWFGNAANQRWYAVAAGLAVLTAGVGLLQDSLRSPDMDGGEVVMRGEEAPQRIAIATADVGRKLQSIVAILEQHQIVYLIKRTDAGTQIQAKLVPDSEAARQLHELGIATPPHGRVNVVLSSSGR